MNNAWGDNGSEGKRGDDERACFKKGSRNFLKWRSSLVYSFALCAAAGALGLAPLASRPSLLEHGLCGRAAAQLSKLARGKYNLLEGITRIRRTLQREPVNCYFH